MANIAGSQALYRALAGVQRDVSDALQVASDRIGGAIQRNAGRDGRVPVTRLQDVQATSDDAIDEVFTGPNKRPFASDGVTAQAPIPRALNYWYAYAVFGAVAGHSAYIRAHTPDDVQTWLRTARRPQSIPGFSPMHTWVDPNGLILSDRIWQNGLRTRLKMRGLLADGIRQGTAATTLANRVEQFLLPGRANIRTQKPYGTDGSFDAMRLTRTEIARAHGQGTVAAVRQNPYADKVAWHTSASHPRQDICDANRDSGPYAPDDVPAYPAHAMCICYLTPEVTRSPADVTDELQADMQSGEDAPFTPIQTNDFVETLIGGYLLGLIAEKIREAA